MRILITNLFVASYSGSEVVTELLADGLRRAGHTPTVFAPTLGPQGTEANRRGIPVTDRIGAVVDTPDVIHAQHVTPALIAMVRFPRTPVVYTCHSAHYTVETPLPHPQIREVVAVDDSCAEKCREAGVAESALSVILNAVDLERFRTRGPLPDKPVRALLLAKASGHREAVAAACRGAGMTLDEIGPAFGNVVSDLADRLREYDVVFATARMAIEAAAVGCAVIVCDDRGFAGMLKSRDLDAWRRLNLGVGLLREPTTQDNLEAAIAAYDAADAMRVRDLLRSKASAEHFIDRYLETYRRAIEATAPDPDAVARANAHWAEELSVTPADRIWRQIASEMNMHPSASPHAATMARLDELGSVVSAGLTRLERRLDAGGGGRVARLKRILRAALSPGGRT